MDADGNLTPAAQQLRDYYYQRPDIAKDTGKPTTVVKRFGRGRRAADMTFPAAEPGGPVHQIPVPKLRFLPSGMFAPMEIVPGRPIGRSTVDFDDLGLSLDDRIHLQRWADRWMRSMGKLRRVVRRPTAAERTARRELTRAEVRRQLAEQLAADPPGTPQNAGEDLGESFARAMLRWLETVHPGEIILRVPGTEAGGPGRFDQIYVRMHATTGKILGFAVVEAKSVAGTLGSRRGADGRSYEQGHREYVRSILAAMQRRNLPSNERGVADAMQAALDSGDLQYFVAKARVELRPSRAVAKGLAVTEYDMSQSPDDGAGGTPTTPTTPTDLTNPHNEPPSGTPDTSNATPPHPGAADQDRSPSRPVGVQRTETVGATKQSAESVVRRDSFPAEAVFSPAAVQRLESAVQAALTRGLHVELTYSTNPQTNQLEAAAQITDPTTEESVIHRTTSLEDLAARIRPSVARTAEPTQIRPAAPAPEVRPTDAAARQGGIDRALNPYVVGARVDGDGPVSGQVVSNESSNRGTWSFGRDGEPDEVVLELGEVRTPEQLPGVPRLPRIALDWAFARDRARALIPPGVEVEADTFAAFEEQLRGLIEGGQFVRVRLQAVAGVDGIRRLVARAEVVDVQTGRLTQYPAASIAELTGVLANHDVLTGTENFKATVGRELAGLDESVASLQRLVDSKREAADQARQAADQASKEKVQEAFDNQKVARQRQAEAEETKQRELADWHSRLADTYEQALAKLTGARDAYAQLLASAGTSSPQHLHAEATRIAAEVTAYRQLLEKQAPLPAVLTPTGRFPQFAALVKAVNQHLTITSTELHQLLSARFTELVSDDGLVLGPTLRLRLTVEQLTEVVDPPNKASEIISGIFQQTARKLSATSTGKFGTSFTLPLTAILKLIGHATNQPWLNDLTLKSGLNLGRARALTANAAEFAQSGTVQDNRGESILYTGKATWQLDTRPTRDAIWTTNRLQGTEELRAWASHAYTVPPSQAVAQRTDLRTGRLPSHAPTTISGLEQLSEDVIDRNAHALDRFGPSDRRQVEEQIRATLTAEVPGRLTERTIVQPLTAGGKPVGHVEVETTFRYEAVERVGADSTTHWQEEVVVGFSNSSTQQTFTASADLSATGGYAGEAVQDIDPTGTDVGPNTTAGRAAARSESISGGGTAIHVGVHRFTGPTQGYRIVLDHRVQLVLDNTPTKPVRGASELLTRIKVNDAYRNGLPVDPATITGDTHHGEPILRGDPRPQTVPGRKLELPAWAIDDNGRLAAAGPWNVQQVTGTDQAFRALVDQLADRGFVPPLDSNGNPDLTKLSRDPVEAQSQLFNLDELRTQLSGPRLQAGYDIASRTGLVITLTHARTAQPVETISLRVDLEQHAARPVGITNDEAVVLLNIGSETAGRSAVRTKNWSWRLDPLSMSSSEGHVSLSYGRNALARALAWFTGGTINQVTLVESTSPVAVFEVDHTLTVEEIGKNELYRSEESARILIDSDLLPYDVPRPGGTPTYVEVPRKVLDRAVLLALRTGDLGDLLPGRLGKLPAVRQQLAAFLNARNLLAHPEWTGTAYRTTLLVPAPGGITRRVPMALTGRVSGPTLVSVTEAVSGDINFALGNHGSATGRTGGGGLEASGGATRAGAKAALSTSDAETRTAQTIWGVERLTIETGRHYVFTADVDLKVAVGNREIPTVTETVFQLAERDALRFYGQHDLNLPLDQVADAVERYLHGHLDLDRRAATSLVRRYRSELIVAEANGVPLPPPAINHTPAALIGKLMPSPHRTGQSPEERLAKVLQDPVQRPIDVPPQHQRQLGSSLIESVELDGDIDLLAEVQEQLTRELGVELASDPVLGQSLFADLAGKRWWGRLEDMLGRTGFVREYPVGKPGQLSSEQVTVRIKAEFTEGAQDLGTAKDVVTIGQRYLYAESSHTTNDGSSHGITVDGAADDVHSGTAGTDRAAGTSTTDAEQRTRLERLATFDGVRRVGRGLRLTVEVTLDPATATKSPLGRRVPLNQPLAIDAPTLTIAGQVVQLIPTGALARTSISGVEQEIELPTAYYVEGVETGALADVVSGELAAGDLLGARGVEVHRAELAAKLGASAVNASFSRMAGAEGFKLDPFEVVGGRQQTVGVTIQARVSQVEVVGVSNGELGEVNRSQRTVAQSTTTGRLLPVSGSGTLSAPEVMSGGISGGEQISETTTDVRGARGERSRFETGELVTIKVRVNFDLTLQRTAIQADGRERELVHRTVVDAATGEAYMVLQRHEYDALVARQAPTADRPKPRPVGHIHTGTGVLAAINRARKSAEELTQRTQDVPSRPLG
ncbi:hypothetical protein AB0E69_15305 [Kribbella sp. NPDC026611]|uniref:hypothetical protein n=1 Tax=Kribbella sp. NPDC026611 TaxID=3154911 RepID=UPI003408B30D